MSDDWYVQTAKKIHGPLTGAELRQAVSSGLIGPNTPVRRGASGEWVVAKQISGLSFAIGQSEGRKRNADSAEPSFRLGLSARYALGGVSGVALLVVALLVAFELGRQQSIPKPQGPPPAVKAAAEQAPPPVGKPAAKQVAAVVLAAPAPGNAKAAVVHDAPQRKPVVAELPQRNPAVGARPTIPLPVAALPPIPKIPTNDREIKALEVAAIRLPSAKNVLALYEHFAARHSMTVPQQATFNAARNIWQGRAKLNLVRLGAKWVTVPELVSAQQEAAQLVEQAYQMARVLNFAEALRTLRKASQVDPNSIAADFTLGLIYSLS